MTGPDSPAKVAIRKALEKAKEKQKKLIIVGAIKAVKKDIDASTGKETANVSQETYKAVAAALTTAGVKKEVAEVLEREGDNEDVAEVLHAASSNPEVAETFSKKLVEAKDENDVAEAIEGAKAEVQLAIFKDPVQRKRIVEEAKIAVCKVRTDLKAKKAEQEAEKEFDEAESEEQIEKIYEKNENKASELEGGEVVAVRERAYKSKVDVKAKMEEYRKKIQQRVADMRLRGLLWRIVMRSKVATKRLSWQVGRTLQSVRSDAQAAIALAAAKKRGEATIVFLKKQIADFKLKVPKSGASEKMQKWAIANVDKGLKNVEDINRGIQIFNNIARSKIEATKAIFAKRKDLSKKLYLAKTKEDVDTILNEGTTRYTTIKVKLEKDVQGQIDKGKDLKGVMPKEEFSVKNATSYLTSQGFMSQTKKDVTKDLDKNFDKVQSGFKRRAAMVYKRILRLAIVARRAALRKKAAEARARIVALRVKKQAALAKLVALRAKNAWVKKANEDDDATSTEAAKWTAKKAILVKVKARWEAAKKKWEERKLRLQGIRTRIIAIRVRIQANIKRRMVWRLRTQKFWRRVRYLRMRRKIIWARLKRLRLRR